MPPVPLETKEAIMIWERIIDVQKHFNEIKSKNQTLFVSVITASIAATGLLFKNQGNASILCLYFYSLPILGACIFTLAFYILDFGIYQSLLKGAVDCGVQFEKDTLDLKLTSRIVEEASHNITTLGIRKSSTKLQFFYGIIGFSLFFTFVFLNLPLWLSGICKLYNSGCLQ